jgi:hypothetical protein
MTITVWVYEKRGLKRGPGLLDAWITGGAPAGPRLRLPGTGGGPLGEPRYEVELGIWTIGGEEFIPRSEGWIYANAPAHHPWGAHVNDGETHSIWLAPS